MVDSPERVRSSLQTTERTLLSSIVILDLAFPLALVLAAWPQPWAILEGEQSPINWLSSVQCAGVAIAAFAVWSVTRAGIASGSDLVRRAWPWLVLAAGFALLAADEQFMFHERLREEVFRPRGLFNVPGLHRGDIVLLAVAAAGSVFALLLLADLRRYRLPLWLFAAALGLICVIVVQDALSMKVLRNPRVRHTQIIVEEVGEVWAQALFGCSFVTLFFDKLAGLIAPARRVG